MAVRTALCIRPTEDGIRGGLSLRAGCDASPVYPIIAPSSFPLNYPISPKHRTIIPPSFPPYDPAGYHDMRHAPIIVYIQSSSLPGISCHRLSIGS